MEKFLLAIVLLAPIFLLMLTIPAEKRYLQTYKGQRYKQFLLYFSEMYMAIMMGISFLTFIEQGDFVFWNSGETFFDYFQRGLASYTVYQIFVIVILQTASEKDSLLANKKLVRTLINKLNYGISIEEEIAFLLQKVNDGSIMFTNSTLNNFRVIIYESKNIKDENDIDRFIFNLKQQEINLDHEIQFQGLAWQSSFFLRFVK